jgi:glutamine amidotransferase-like uncharacterized protein
MTTRRVSVLVYLVLVTAVCTGCGARGDAPGVAPILLFNGDGTSPGDVTAIRTVLNRNHLRYSTANSAQLNAMDTSQIRRHRLLIVPGGNFIEIGKGLTSSSAENIRNAVHEGVNYLGVCAGGFLAGNTGYNSFNLTSGVKFGFYAAERQGIRKAAVPIAGVGPGGPTLEQYWEDGPEFTGWGTVVATYPDGTPAVVEGTSGNGWVVLTGVHPEATADWRQGMTFSTPVNADNAYAATLVHAALNRTSLAHK